MSFVFHLLVESHILANNQKVVIYLPKLVRVRLLSGVLLVKLAQHTLPTPTCVHAQVTPLGLDNVVQFAPVSAFKVMVWGLGLGNPPWLGQCGAVRT